LNYRPAITHVAIRFQGKTWSLPRPNRHHDVIRHIAEQTGVRTVDARGEDQGFLDASGRYLTRKEALVNAQANGQMLADRPILNRQLYSENLWKTEAGGTSEQVHGAASEEEHQREGSGGEHDAADLRELRVRECVEQETNDGDDNGNEGIHD
jgi:hypothetical protein